MSARKNTPCSPQESAHVVPLRLRCRCAGAPAARKVPLRIRLAGASALARQLRAVPFDLLSTVYLDYACPHCQAVVEITIADLLGPSEGVQTSALVPHGR